MPAELKPNNFHDAILQRLVVDIEAKETQLVLKQWNWPNEAFYTISVLTFNSVAWQNFEIYKSLTVFLASTQQITSLSLQNIKSNI